jgi:hypothetical protein
MSSTIQFVGGPLDGEQREWTTARYVTIPDAKDMVHVYVPRWGETRMLFGEHTYEMRSYAIGGEVAHQLHYVGYRKPTIGEGMVQIGDGKVVLHE